MSLYRFARTSALLAFAGKYRLKIFYMLAAIAFALVTAWLYGDVAAYLEVHFPQWVVLALLVKTFAVYAALFFLLWQVKPSEWRNRPEPEPEQETSAEVEGIEPQSKLDEIARKENLNTRKDAILNK
jgi:hypothetical protein